MAASSLMRKRPGPPNAPTLRLAAIDLPVERGLLIIEAVRGAPAAKAGLNGSSTTRVNGMSLPIGGDVIVAINKQPVRSFQGLTVYLESHTQVGEKVVVTVIRDGQRTRLRHHPGRTTALELAHQGRARTTGREVAASRPVRVHEWSSQKSLRIEFLLTFSKPLCMLFSIDWG